MSDRGSFFVGYAKIKVEISNESNRLLERYGKFLRELFGVEGIFAEEKREVYVNGFYTNGRPRNQVYGQELRNVFFVRNAAL